MLRSLVALFMLVAAAHAAPPVQASDRISHLARGVNVSNWFWYARSLEPDAVRAFITPDDVAQLKAAGFTHVRVPFEPSFVWDDTQHALKPDRVEIMKQSLASFTDAGLAVIVDAHPNTTAWVKRGTAEFTDEYEKFWSALAASFSTTNPELVFLEIMNEPHDYKDKALWPAQQARLVKAVRAAAPTHTIIVTGEEWGGISGLCRLAPLDDPNLIYSFHFYEPMTFTHQGATWGAPNWKDLRDVPYPPTPERIEASSKAAKSDKARDETNWYGKQGWGPDKIEKQIAQAAAWAKEHNAAIYCGEFGAYAEHCPPADRAVWLADVTGALAKHQIGWAMWDYAGGFRIRVESSGKRTLDSVVLKALGLPPASR